VLKTCRPYKNPFPGASSREQAAKADSSPASRLSATWARKAQALPTPPSATLSIRGSSPVLAAHQRQRHRHSRGHEDANSFNPAQHVLSNADYANSADQLISVIRAQHKEGSDFAKVYETGPDRMVADGKGGPFCTRPTSTTKPS